MKIAILIDILPSKFISGVAVSALELIEGLASFGHQVLVFAPRQKTFLPKNLNRIKIIYVPTISTPYPGFPLCLPYTWTVYKQIRNFKPDLIHLPGPSFLGIDGLITSKLLKIPNVAAFQTMFTDRKYIQNITKVNFGLSFLEKLSWGYHRFFYNLTDTILAITPGNKDILISKGFDKNKIKVLPVATDLSLIKILSEKGKKHLKNKYMLNDRVAIYLGRLSAEKSLDSLLLIFREVVSSFPDCSLLVIGDGPYLEEMKILVSKLGLENQVKMIGLMEHKELMSSGLLSIGDVFVSTSTTETLGLAGVEAMAHGVPVVLFKSQGLAELVEGAGFICQREDLKCFKEAILKIFKEPGLKAVFFKKARKIAAQFDRREVTKQTLQLYQKVIKNHQEKRKNDTSP